MRKKNKFSKTAWRKAIFFCSYVCVVALFLFFQKIKQKFPWFESVVTKNTFRICAVIIIIFCCFYSVQSNCTVFVYNQ